MGYKSALTQSCAMVNTHNNLAILLQTLVESLFERMHDHTHALGRDYIRTVIQNELTSQKTLVLSQLVRNRF